MSLLQVSVRIQSDRLCCQDITGLLGVYPSQCGRAGDSTNWVFAVRDPRDVASAEGALSGVLGRIDSASEVSDLDVEVVLMVEAAPLGGMVALSPEFVQVMASVGCGLIVDAYDSDDR